jgi:hypothetical protein
MPFRVGRFMCREAIWPSLSKVRQPKLGCSSLIFAVAHLCAKVTAQFVVARSVKALWSEFSFFKSRAMIAFGVDPFIFDVDCFAFGVDSVTFRFDSVTFGVNFVAFGVDSVAFDLGSVTFDGSVRVDVVGHPLPIFPSC